jgi:nitrate reductase gamma subunit
MEIVFMSYISIFIFLLTLIYKIIKFSNSPVHLRWELYPVPKEKGKSEYGGSILEESEWWTKKKHIDHLGEVKTMAEEIFLLKGVYEKNKELWFGSYPFHFGLYIGITNIIFSAITVILKETGIIDFSVQMTLMYIMYVLLAVGSLTGLVGAIKLLISRIKNNGLRLYSAPAHYFHIIFIGLIYLSGIIWVATDQLLSFSIMEYFKCLFSAEKVVEMSFFGYIHIYLILAFIAYLPSTHMSHFFTKYFTFHKVRWDDEPNSVGSKIEAQVTKLLMQPVTWSATHINADGVKNWLNITGEKPNKESNNE